MGSYASLQFGHFSMGQWKSHVPLEPLLLFAQDDYKEELDCDREAVTHKFVTTAAVARHRIDARGLTIAVCEHLYEEFRVARFWHHNSKTNREWSTPNKATYEKYLAACRQLFKKYHTWYLMGSGAKVSKRLRRIFSDELFGDDIEYYFEDAFYFILMRSFLEIVPADCPIVLDMRI